MMNNKIIEFAEKQYHSILQDTTLTPQKRLYNLSMPLLAMATMNDKRQYDQIRIAMHTIIIDPASHIDSHWASWMLGRMILAAKIADDAENFNNYKNQLSRKLEAETSTDPFTGWAIAYLAIADQESYTTLQLRLRDYADHARLSYESNIHDKDKASTYIWTLVMNLYAAATAENTADYQYHLGLLRALSPDNTLAKTVQLVPEADYRQWLISLIRLSLRFTEDQDELAPIEAQEIHTPDTMLTLANESTLTRPIRTLGM